MDKTNNSHLKKLKNPPVSPGPSVISTYHVCLFAYVWPVQDEKAIRFHISYENNLYSVPFMYAFTFFLSFIYLSYLSVPTILYKFKWNPTLQTCPRQSLKAPPQAASPTLGLHSVVVSFQDGTSEPHFLVLTFLYCPSHTQGLA